MFHNKQMKQQLEEANQIKAQSIEYQQILDAMGSNVAEVQVEVDQLEMSATRLDRSLTYVVDFARDTVESQTNSEARLQDLQGQMTQLIGQASEAELIRSRRQAYIAKQQDGLLHLQEQSKRYTGLSKSISEAVSQDATYIQEMQEMVKSLYGFSSNIANLALQSAIDAGRMGDESSEYIKTAEMIRSLASEFANKSDVMGQQMAKLQDSVDGMQQEIHSFISLLKDNNISLGKLATDTAKEAQSTDWDGAKMQQDLTAVQDNITAVETDIVAGKQRQEQILSEMESIGTCYMQQQTSTDKIEDNIQAMKQMLSNK